MPEEITLHTSVTIPLGKPVTLGGSESMTETFGSGLAKNDRKSKIRYVLVLDEYTALSD